MFRRLKMVTKIWYSVQNCGDGSAYPKLMESEELCELDQKYMDEGWGESCTGSIVIESNAPITVKNEIITVEEAITYTRYDLNYYSDGPGKRFVEEYLTALLKLKEIKDERNNKLHTNG